MQRSILQSLQADLPKIDFFILPKNGMEYGTIQNLQGLQGLNLEMGLS